MNYQERIEESQRKVYEKAVATKILDLMNKLRMSGNINDRKRWIWELLQNAKDVRNIALGGVHIVIDFSEQEKVVIFQHNGKCFSTENITFLIEQVSTKERSEDVDESQRTTGKFGTGFLTTHLLSELVEIDGVVKDDNLPYRKFNITLDRSKEDIEGVIQSVKKSIDQLKELDKAPDYETYQEIDFNTSFTYHLDQDGIQTAAVGITDLEKNIAATLIFLSSITQVEIKRTSTSYKVNNRMRLDDLVDDSNTNYSLNIVQKKTASTEEDLTYILIQNQDCAITFPIELAETYQSLLPLDDEIPRIFCDFPLIGSETFGTPFILNSPFFYPNEPRSGIFLVDKNRPQVLENKKIVKQAVDLYLNFIEYASQQNFKGLHCLAQITVPSNLDWLSDSWYKNYILAPLQNKIYSAPLIQVDTQSRCPLKGRSGEVLVHIPFHKDATIRDAIWDLVQNLDDFQLPIKSEIHNWYQVFRNKIWDKNHCLTLEAIANYLTKNIKDLETLEKKLGIRDGCEWLNRYFAILTDAGEEVIDFLEKYGYPLIPNQYGELCLPSQLSYDKDIEVILKDISRDLFKDYYKVLAHKDIKIGTQLKHQTQPALVESLNRALSSASRSQQQTACQRLSCLFPEGRSPSAEDQSNQRWQGIYNITNLAFQLENSEKIYLKHWSDKIREISDRLQAEYITIKISQQENLLKLSQYCSETLEETKQWLKRFVDLLVASDWTNLFREYSLLPNQNGTFCLLEDLSAEAEPIDEDLKDIATSLRRDFRNELIDTFFDVKFPQNAKITSKQLADHIQETIRPRLVDNPRNKEVQNICNQIILWMDGNEELAEKIFGDFYETRHRLYDDAEVAENLRQVKQLKRKVTQLTDENTHLKDENQKLQQELEELKARFSIEEESKVKAHSFSKDIVNIKDILLSYNIESAKELEKFKDSPWASMILKIENSQQSLLEKYQYVKKINSRAKKNVKEYLEQNPNYDCSGWTEQGQSIITGVLKNNHLINLLIRPSDNRKIIFYRREEQEILAVPDSELWVDDGCKKPEQMTLGRVLQLEGINQIDL